jgi:hypothetical protein
MSQHRLRQTPIGDSSSIDFIRCLANLGHLSRLASTLLQCLAVSSFHIKEIRRKLAQEDTEGFEAIGRLFHVRS